VRIRIMTGDEVRATVSMTRAIDAVRAAFAGLATGEFELPPRNVLGGGRFFTMTAHHAPSMSAAVKSITFDAGRQPSVQGTVSYVAIGRDEAMILDAEAVTALRTGAVVGVATAVLAPVDAARLTLIGLGGQAADQLRAVRAVRPIASLTLVGRRLDAVNAFRAAHAAELGDLQVEVSTDPATAVGGADIVCCATPATEPLFPAAALPAVVHVNAVGAYRLAMRELPDDLLADAFVVVDQRDAALEESGEIHHAIDAGRLHEQDLVELSAVPTDFERPDRTVFKSVGLAVQDWAIAHAVACWPLPPDSRSPVGEPPGDGPILLRHVVEDYPDVGRCDPADA
jgi:ornithine cyclodeaminase/alanine dehydrogenase-like protein (mu-crystallin family)